MDTQPVASGAGAVSLIGAPVNSTDLGRDDFLNLLVAQLGNQDPLEPTANEDFIAQLASFSSLDSLEAINENIVSMIALNQSNAVLSQLTQGADLIGKSVTWSDPSSGDSGTGLVESVKLTDGFAYLTVDGEQVALHNVKEVTAAPDSSSDDSDNS